MEFRVLGPLEVSEAGRPIPIAGSKRRAVLAMLVLHANEVVGRDRVIDELWGENPPRTAQASLHNHVSRLRKSLGPEVVATKPWGYVLRAEPNSIDLERFRALVADAEPLPAEERAEKLRQALALWRGRPLEDLLFEPALAREIAEVEELRLSVLERRIEADLEVGRHADVIPELEHLIAQSPFREHLRAQLILALYRGGRQAEALEVYRETRRVLADELGLDPNPELRELERAILRQDPALTAEPPPREEPPPDAPPPPPPERRRRLLLAVAVGAAVAVGVSAALAASWHHGSAPSSVAAKFAERPATTTSAQPPPKNVTHGVANKPRVVHRKMLTGGPATKPRVPSGPQTHAKSVQPASQPPRTKTKVGAPARPRHTVTPRGRNRTVAPPPAQVRIADTFSDGTVDRDLWYRLADSGSEINELDGRLELAIHAGAVPGGDWNQVSAQIGTACHFAGDFDARVDFELQLWPEANGSYLQLGTFVESTGAGISRSGQAGRGYEAWIQPSASSTTSAESKGRLRLARVGGVVSAYYWRARRWVLLERSRLAGYANIGLQLFAPAASFGHVEIAAAFDNFVVTGAHEPTAACPAA